MNISELIGKTLVNIQQDGNECLTFTTNTGDVYKMYHVSDCCEQVYLEDVCGVFDDLLDSPIVQAEENSSHDAHPAGCKSPNDGYEDESFTWTFYRLATAKGQVVLRWYGSSNGYYSESVDFQKMS